MGQGRRIARAIAVVGLLCGLSAPLGTTSFAAGWSTEHTVNVGVPTGVLAGISCVSSAACLDVGVHANQSGTELGVAQQLNGSSWATRPPARPSGSNASELRGVSCFSANGCIAVGGWVNGFPTE